MKRELNLSWLQGISLFSAMISAIFIGVCMEGLSTDFKSTIWLIGSFFVLYACFVLCFGYFIENEM